QIIVAQGLTNSQSDQDQLTPRLDDIEADLGVRPDELSADAGFASEANFAVLVARDVEGYIATARAKHPANTKRTPTGVLTRAMRAKLRRAGWRQEADRGAGVRTDRAGARLPPVPAARHGE